MGSSPCSPTAFPGCEPDVGLPLGRMTLSHGRASHHDLPMEGVLRVVIAAFDEAAGLRLLLPALPERLHGLDVRPIVVSDGSSDDTAAVARAHGASVIEFARNHGKGTAVQAGVARALGLGCDVLVTMDGDGQHAVDDLADVAGPVARGEADVVLGSRYLEDPGRHGVPVNRYLVRRATILILRRLLSRTFTDPYCGYRAFSRRAVDLIAFEGSGYEIELEAIFDSERHGLAVVEVPVARIYGEATSKMGTRRGRLLGRLAVLWCYTRTIVGRARRRSGTPRAAAPVQRNG